MNTFLGSCVSTVTLKKLLGVRGTSTTAIRRDDGVYGQMLCPLGAKKSAFLWRGTHRCDIPLTWRVGMVRGPETNLVSRFPRARTFPAHAWSSLEHLGDERTI